MPSITELYNKHKGETAYIIGTGPSMAFFPVDFLKNKLTIGLNQAYKYLNCKYNISIHPEIIAEAPKLNWITRRKGGDILNLDRYYLFKSNGDYKLPVTDFRLTKGHDGCLYVGRGIHTAALNLSAQFGCKFACMIGVDCGNLNNLHHGHQQHVQFHSINSELVYREYYECIVKLRGLLYIQYSMYTFSLNPFIGLGYHQEDYKHLAKLYNIQLPESEPVDISTYSRTSVDKFL